MLCACGCGQSGRDYQRCPRNCNSVLLTDCVNHKWAVCPDCLGSKKRRVTGDDAKEFQNASLSRFLVPAENEIDGELKFNTLNVRF